MLHQSHLFLSEAHNPSFSEVTSTPPHTVVCQLAFFVSGDFIAQYVARMNRTVMGLGLQLMFSLSIHYRKNRFLV